MALEHGSLGSVQAHFPATSPHWEGAPPKVHDMGLQDERLAQGSGGPALHSQPAEAETVHVPGSPPTVQAPGVHEGFLRGPHGPGSMHLQLPPTMPQRAAWPLKVQVVLVQETAVTQGSATHWQPATRV